MLEEKNVIVGKFITSIYQGENNFAIDIVEQNNGEQISVKGYNLPKQKFRYEYHGKTVIDKTYGETFVADYAILFTKSKEDIINYLSKNIDGIGKKTAERFYDMFHEQTLEAFKDKAKIGLIIKNPEKIEKIYKSAQENLIDTEFTFFMLRYDVSMNVINKVLENEEEPMKKIEKNPFSFEKYQIPFTKLNKICIDLNCDTKSPERIQGGIFYYLNEEIGKRGNLYSMYDNLLEGVKKLLNSNLSAEKRVSNEDINLNLRSLKNKDLIHLEKTKIGIRIYSDKNYVEETYIAKRLSELINMKPNNFYTNKDLLPYIEKYENIENVKLSDKQKLAISTVINNSVSIITGSAGTGKTTVLKFCISIFRDIFNTDNVLLIAPTGRAARRMSEKTNWEAFTIHSRLGITNEGEVMKEIDEDIAFADEMSMTDNSVLYKMLVNSAPFTKFVFLGDFQQLPSVGAGNVLKDMIESKTIPVVELDVIYRQAKESNIISNANRIIKGDSSFTTGDDFVFVNKTGSVEIQDTVVEIFFKEFFENTKDLNEVQIITPMREKGYLSAKQINIRIQEQLVPKTPNKHSIIANGYEFRVKDKVICQKNTEEVKNGEIGIVTDIYLDENNKLVALIDFYGTKFEFNKDELKDLNFALAYAITVHKSQGSEFKTVILPINSENKIMLKRNLLYTAVTRASEKMIIVGSQNHYWDAVKNNVVAPRNTALAARLRMLNKIQKTA